MGNDENDNREASASAQSLEARSDAGRSPGRHATREEVTSWLLSSPDTRTPDQVAAIAKLFTHFPKIRNAGEASLSSLARQVIGSQIGRGEVLFRVGEPVDGLYLLLDGAVALYDAPNNGHITHLIHHGPSHRANGGAAGASEQREDVLQRWGAWELIGDQVVLAGIRWPGRAQVESNRATLICVSRHLFHETVSLCVRASFNRKIDFLARLPVFSNMPRRVVERLAPFFFEGEKAPKDLLCRQGDPADCLWAIVTGRCYVVIDPQWSPAASRTPETDPKRTTQVAALQSGNLIGEMCVFGNVRHRAATVRCATDMLFYRLKRLHFLRICPPSLLEELRAIAEAKMMMLIQAQQEERGAATRLNRVLRGHSLRALQPSHRAQLLRGSLDSSLPPLALIPPYSHTVVHGRTVAAISRSQVPEAPDQDEEDASPKRQVSTACAVLDLDADVAHSPWHALNAAASEVIRPLVLPPVRCSAAGMRLDAALVHFAELPDGWDESFDGDSYADGVALGGSVEDLNSSPGTYRTASVPALAARALPAPTTVAALPFGCGYTFLQPTDAPARPSGGAAAAASGACNSDVSHAGDGEEVDGATRPGRGKGSFSAASASAASLSSQPGSLSKQSSYASLVHQAPAAAGEDSAATAATGSGPNSPRCGAAEPSARWGPTSGAGAAGVEGCGDDGGGGGNGADKVTDVSDNACANATDTTPAWTAADDVPLATACSRTDVNGAVATVTACLREDKSVKSVGASSSRQASVGNGDGVNGGHVMDSYGDVTTDGCGAGCGDVIAGDGGGDDASSGDRSLQLLRQVPRQLLPLVDFSWNFGPCSVLNVLYGRTGGYLRTDGTGASARTAGAVHAALTATTTVHVPVAARDKGRQPSRKARSSTTTSIAGAANADSYFGATATPRHFDGPSSQSLSPGPKGLSAATADCALALTRTAVEEGTTAAGGAGPMGEGSPGVESDACGGGGGAAAPAAVAATGALSELPPPSRNRPRPPWEQPPPRQLRVTYAASPPPLASARSSASATEEWPVGTGGSETPLLLIAPAPKMTRIGTREATPTAWAASPAASGTASAPAPATATPTHTATATATAPGCTEGRRPASPTGSRWPLRRLGGASSRSSTPESWPSRDGSYDGEGVAAAQGSKRDLLEGAQAPAGGGAVALARGSARFGTPGSSGSSRRVTSQLRVAVPSAAAAGRANAQGISGPRGGGGVSSSGQAPVSPLAVTCRLYDRKLGNQKPASSQSWAAPPPPLQTEEDVHGPFAAATAAAAAAAAVITAGLVQSIAATDCESSASVAVPPAMDVGASPPLPAAAAVMVPLLPDDSIASISPNVMDVGHEPEVHQVLPALPFGILETEARTDGDPASTVPPSAASGASDVQRELESFADGEGLGAAAATTTPADDDGGDFEGSGSRAEGVGLYADAGAPAEAELAAPAANPAQQQQQNQQQQQGALLREQHRRRRRQAGSVAGPPAVMTWAVVPLEPGSEEAPSSFGAFGSSAVGSGGHSPSLSGPLPTPFLSYHSYLQSYSARPASPTPGGGSGMGATSQSGTHLPLLRLAGRTTRSAHEHPGTTLAHSLATHRAVFAAAAASLSGTTSLPASPTGGGYGGGGGGSASSPTASALATLLTKASARTSLPANIKQPDVIVKGGFVWRAAGRQRGGDAAWLQGGGSSGGGSGAGGPSLAGGLASLGIQGGMSLR